MGAVVERWWTLSSCHVTGTGGGDLGVAGVMDNGEYLGFPEIVQRVRHADGHGVIHIE